MSNNTKRWAVKNRRSGKISRSFSTRALARLFKADNNFRYSIVDTATGMEVR